jgi:hypothetical protein
VPILPAGRPTTGLPPEIAETSEKVFVTLFCFGSLAPSVRHPRSTPVGIQWLRYCREQVPLRSSFLMSPGLSDRKLLRGSLLSSHFRNESSRLIDLHSQSRNRRCRARTVCGVSTSWPSPSIMAVVWRSGTSVCGWRAPVRIETGLSVRHTKSFAVSFLWPFESERFVSKGAAYGCRPR